MCIIKYLKFKNKYILKYIYTLISIYSVEFCVAARQSRGIMVEYQRTNERHRFPENKDQRNETLSTSMNSLVTSKP